MEGPFQENAPDTLDRRLLVLSLASPTYPAGTCGTVRDWIAEHHVPLLLLGIVLLLPFSLSFQIPYMILAGIGIHRIVQDRSVLWSTPTARVLLVVFLLLWVPPLLALPHAEAPFRAIGSTTRLLVFLFAGVAVIQYMQSRDGSRFLYAGILVIASFWILDASIQFVTGHNLLGYPLTGDQLTGIFHPKMRLGIVLAHLSPLYLEALRRCSARTPWVWLLVIPLALVIILSGSRSAWFTLLLTLLAYGMYLVRFQRVGLRYLMATALIILLAGAALVERHPGLQYRLDKTVALSSLGTKADLAIAERITAWQAALRIFHDDRLFGVGIRGFESAALERGYVAQSFSHPHMFLLDVATSAGIIGLAGYAAALGLLAWFFWIRLRGFRTALFAPWLAVALILFPFNVHWGFYATFLSSLLWLILLIALGMTASRDRVEST